METTASKGSVTIDACVCDRGFRLDVASSACVACELNSYKSQPGNLEACTPCPSGFTTYTTGSVWASSCHNIASDVPGDTSSPGVGVSNDSGNGSADNDTDSGNSTPVQLQPVQPATQNESSVPAITFSMSLSNFPVQAGAGDLKEQLKAVFARTLSATTRLDQNAIQIEIIGLDTSNSSRRLRRLAAPTGPTVVITIKARSPEEAAETASDMDVNVVTSEVMTAVQQHPTLADIGIQLTPESDIAITTATVTCPQHQAVPPGVPVLSPEDCQCSPGYSPAADTCEPCRRGKYKVDVSNGACTDCPQLMSTLNEGATSMLECQCEAGLYADENGACIACLEGFYCPGTGQAVICPQNSTTVSPGSSQQSACICLAGYYFASAELWCEPCQRRRYKPNQGNGECALTCPTNADSELASTSLDDCFCMPGFHANIDSAGKLASCTSCSYQGLICEGGFVKANLTNLTNLSNIPQVHAQPLATPGFYQTGQSSSVECDVLLPDGSSACRGGGLCVAQRLQLPTPSGCNGVFGNACAEGSTGMLCGECPEGFSRDNYPELCQPCPAGAAALLSVGILSDIFQKAFLNFVVAAMAATSAVKGSAKLHTSMIRIGTQWLAACSVINQFNLDRLSGFEWAQKQAEMDQLTACSEANATECVVDQQAGNFAWPKEISDAINWVFNLMTVAPRLGSVEFSAQCHAEELLPGDKLAKMVAPGIYYISSPLLAMIGVLLVCSVMVYVVVPVFATAGIYFNNAAKAKQKKKKIIKALKKALEPLLPDAGLSWTDVQESEILESHHDATLESAALEPQKFIEGGFSYCRPLALKMCLHHLESNTDAAESWKRVGLSWDEFTEKPDFLAQGLEKEDEGLSAAANGKMWSGLLDTLVLRALAWKLRDRYPEVPEVEQEKIAHAVASAHDSASSLFEISANAEEFELFVQSQCEKIRHSPEEVEEGAQEGKQSNDLDPDALDFGLFTAFPTPRQLLQLCPPVFWVTLLAMWPELLSKFLQMVWCTPISGEDAGGKILVEQRLLPHPDVVCWSRDHFATALIAGIGLGVWCALVPILLFLRIYNLKDRQSPENFRRYGYFIEGYEPQFWWWDILVKRTDIGLMNLVTYTSVADDEKAKLLLFPFISGGMLAVAAWCKPFANTQAEILDFLEMSLLSFRFVLFSAVCMLLIFNPSPEATYAVAGTLALLLAGICAYFGLHVLVQILRTTADESSEEEDFETPKTGKTGLSQSQAEAKKKKQNPLVRFIGNVKKRVVDLALPLFQESEDEKLLVEWSVQNNSCKLVSAAIVHHSQKLLVQSSSGRAVAMAKGARAQLLRFGAAYQKRTITKAFEEFATLWLDQFDQETLPADTVQVLCALTSSSKHVPARVPKRHLAARWRKKAEELLHHHSLLSKSEISTWHFAADDLLDTTQRMSKLAAKDAVYLVNGAQMALQEHRDRHAESLIVREPVEEEPEEPAVPTEGLPLDSQEAEVMPVMPVPDIIHAVKDVVMIDRAVQTSLTLPVKKAAPVPAIEAPKMEALPVVSERKKPIKDIKERAPEAPQGADGADVDLKDVFAKLLESEVRKAPSGPSGPSPSRSSRPRPSADALLGQSSQPSQPSQPQAMPAEVFFIPSQEVQTLPSPGGRKVAKHPRPVSPNAFLRNRPTSPSRSPSPTKGPKSESDSGHSRSQSPAPAVRSVMPETPEAVPPGSSEKSSKATQSERASI